MVVFINHSKKRRHDNNFDIVPSKFYLFGVIVFVLVVIAIFIFGS